ncbi:unnamed protein product [Scytosiphon promiscuus]
MAPFRSTPVAVAAALAVAASSSPSGVTFVGGFVVPPSASSIARSTQGAGIASAQRSSPVRRAPSWRGSGGGSSTSLQMNLADRFLRVAKANLNNILQTWEDPEKILEQAVDDMQKDLVKIRQSYAEVSATQKRMDRQKQEADRLATNWYDRAQLALQNGDEDLAREALARRQQQLDTSASMGQQMTVQGEALDKLRDSMQQLEAKITEAKVNPGRADTLIARARTAKTTTQVNDMLGSITGTTSMDAFDRMQEKVETLEANAEIAGELSGSTSVSLEGKFKALEGNNAVDDELAKMKGLLPSKKEPTPLLPSNPAVESELDQMKREMGGGSQ